METIGNRAYKEIKKQARQNGIAPYKEALKFGVTSHTLTDWKKGNGNPCAYYLQQMTLAGYDVIYILVGERKDHGQA